MDMYGTTAQDIFPIDDLLDFSNDEIFTCSSTTTSTDNNYPLPSLQNPCIDSLNPSYLSTDFTDDLGVPSDDVAELEWLSQFVDDSFTDFPTNSNTGSGTLTFRSDTSLSGRGRSKRSKPTTNTWTWTSSSETETSGNLKPTPERRCTHCASEKTPQWRTGPLGPKTLCNACGVRYKSGRLVPEYRPAASPTFVLTQHSNSHRKVLELRRQKDMLRDDHQDQICHQCDFEVC